MESVYVQRGTVVAGSGDGRWHLGVVLVPNGEWQGVAASILVRERLKGGRLRGSEASAIWWK